MCECECECECDASLEARAGMRIEEGGGGKVGRRVFVVFVAGK